MPVPSRNLFVRYAHWLHTRWPAGVVEHLPEVGSDGSTRVPGVYVVGDLTGIPLLKFSADTGAKAVQALAADPRFVAERKDRPGGVHDLVIIGAGVSGMAAALEARKLGLDAVIVEATQVFSTVVNFPAGKPIYTYPQDMTPAGQLQFTAQVKEPLLDELRAQTAGVTVTAARVTRIRRERGVLHCELADAEGQKAAVPELRALRVIIAIGRSGNFRKLGVPGEELNKVYNRLHDPKDYAGKRVLVVGGGDTALETAIALVQGGAEVTLSYRKPEFARPKPDNIERLEALEKNPRAPVAIEQPTSERVTTATGDFLKPPAHAGKLTRLMSSQVQEIRDGEVVLRDADQKLVTLPNDCVFVMIGREAPLDFLRRSGLRISGEWTRRSAVACALFFLFCVALYNWKSYGALWERHKKSGFPSPHTLEARIDDRVEVGGRIVKQKPWQFLDPQPARPPSPPSEQVVPNAAPAPAPRCGVFPGCAADRTSFLGTVALSASGPSFYYTIAYTLLILIFGWRRIRKRKTPYVTVQTLSLTAIQIVPLFLLPEIILPLLGYHGLLPAGLADSLFPAVDYGHGREYWRAYGFVLAWPLFIYNVFTDQPMWGWLAISLVQTFVLLPTVIYFYGKGAYCGWICSCGALAETLGDDHRHKMVHGPTSNRFNMLGQVILAAAFALLLLRIVGWVFPSLGVNQYFWKLVSGSGDSALSTWINWKWVVDVFLAGIVGYGLYFWYSGRVWCRFMCPLAALMHIYARFSRFRIFPDKKKCISCNVCTSVCHMGIDVMSFANKGVPMQDPECVRCSACVQSCPTGVLSFGRADKDNRPAKLDSLAASPVLIQIRKHPGPKSPAQA